MSGDDDQYFSLGWVFISYFMVCGGMVVAVAALVVFSPERAFATATGPYLACGIGGLVGGFFAGRVSRRFSVMLPAIAGALVIGSVFLLIKYTAIGPIVFAFAEPRLVRESLILGGLSAAGGLTGAIVGRMTVSDGPPAGTLRWLAPGAFLTYGALLATTIATHILLLDHSLRDPDLMRRMFEGGALVAEEDLSTAFLVAVVGAGFIGGLVTQLAAGRRMLSICGGGVFLSITGGLLGLMALVGPLDADGVVGAVVLGGCATMLGLVGAVLGWLYLRWFGPGTS